MYRGGINRMTKNYTCKNPILLLTYKRPDTTLKVFEAIREVKPKKLYLAQNSFKQESEKELVLNLRRALESRLDWECELHTLYREKYLSCKDSVSSAITWFFENEEQGIVLEDDCLPNTSFFRFCDAMLERYKNNENIFMVSGWSALDFDKQAKESLKEDYYFSKYNHIWGWASWARVWRLYQKEFVDFEKEFQALQNWQNKKEQKYWYKIFKAYSQGAFDAWDYPFTYSIWKEQGLSIYPKHNMVQNIGFNRDDATNTHGDSKFAHMNMYVLREDIIHPKEIAQNKELDYRDFLICFVPPPFHIRVCNKLKRIAKKLFKS